MGKKVITWNDEADAKLLLGILEISKPKLDYEALAKWMGEGVTVSAVSHRIRRIKDKAKESGLPMGEVGDDNTGTDTAKSPAGTPVKGAKRGRKFTAATAAAAGKIEGPAAKKVKSSGGVSTSGTGYGPAEEGEDGEDANEA